MLLESALIVSSVIAYMLLDDKDKDNSSNTKEENNNVLEADNNFTSTFKYFKNLPVEYQLKYVGYNYDLAPHLDDMSLDNGYLNAYKVARIAEKLGKSFTNDYKRY